MKTHSVLALAVVVAGFAAPTAALAAGRSSDAPNLTYVGFAKQKTVKLSLRNDSNAPMALKVGDNTMTIDAGKTVQVDLPVGTRIVAAENSPTHQAGAVIAQVSNEMKGATIAIR